MPIDEPPLWRRPSQLFHVAAADRNLDVFAGGEPLEVLQCITRATLNAFPEETCAHKSDRTVELWTASFQCCGTTDDRFGSRRRIWWSNVPCSSS